MKALRQRSAEVVVGAVFFLLGAIVIYDSLRVGVKWSEDGPQSGYFPFYIGLIICISSLVNFASAVMKPNREAFVKWGQLRMILVVMVPCVVYVSCDPITLVAHTRVVERRGRACPVRNHEVGARLYLWEILPERAQSAQEETIEWC
jgi:hypothetical protein